MAAEKQKASANINRKKYRQIISTNTMHPARAIGMIRIAGQVMHAAKKPMRADNCVQPKRP